MIALAIIVAAIIINPNYFLSWCADLADWVKEKLESKKKDK